MTVQALHLFGIPALRHGNLIDVKIGLLGINEACSGIRSFQATLMVSLFLGELYQMSWRRRLVLVFSGIWIAFLCNAVRTFLLSWVAAEKGIGSVSLWHDPAGFTILGVCFFGLWGVAHLLAEEPRVLKPSTPGAPRAISPETDHWSGSLVVVYRAGRRDLVPSPRNRNGETMVVRMASPEKRIFRCGHCGPAWRRKTRRFLD